MDQPVRVTRYLQIYQTWVNGWMGRAHGRVVRVSVSNPRCTPRSAGADRRAGKTSRCLRLPWSKYSCSLSRHFELWSAWASSAAAIF